MSLPPGFLDDLRARVPLSQIVGRTVAWDMRRSNRGRGDWWAPCPFHQEKTASFHVDDRKGFYYCFGCQAKGDAIGFLMETGNMGFMEAVEALAREAGMAMPARDPAARAAADRRTALSEVIEEAVRAYRLQLRGAGAQGARDYLARRGLGAASLERWEIGWAPASRRFLAGALAGKGIGPAELEAAGLVAPGEGGPGYDRFAGRIIFPIRDARGRAISLGGRALDPQARAKYLNGPETAIFDKGRTLYNIGPAREAAARGAPVILAEGYMDVIALADAGFGGAVAPLGTAVTAEQLALLWRLHPEPVIALDGDAAGLRAAMRLVDLALPLLEPGRGLRFALMPGGQDPDEVIRAGGAAAMQALVERAEPMVALLLRRETEGKVLDSPERRAAVEAALREATRRIPDRGLRAHYDAALREMAWPILRPARAGAPQRGAGRARAARGAFAAPAAPAAGPLASALAGPAGEAAEERLLAALLLATLAAHPVQVAAFEGDLEALELADPGQQVLRSGLLAGRIEGDAAAALERLRAAPHVQAAPPAAAGADPDLVRLCLAEGFAKLAARRRARAAVAEAEEDITGLADEGLTWRLAQAAAARHRAEAAGPGTVAEGGEDREALSRRLQEMLDGQIWTRRRR